MTPVQNHERIQQLTKVIWILAEKVELTSAEMEDIEKLLTPASPTGKSERVNHHGVIFS